MQHAAIQAHAREIVEACGSALSLPPGHPEMRAIIEDPNGRALQMCEAFARHPELGAALLRLLGGPLHAPATGDWTHHRAVNQLGMQRVLDLSLIAVLPKALERLGSAAGPSEFWPLSIRSGLAARALAERCRRSERDRMWCAGMLAPVGRLLMWHALPESMQAARERAADGESLHAVELELTGTDHVAVAAALARHWQLPLPIVRAIADSASPDRAVPHHLEAAILSLAARLAGLPAHPVEACEPAFAIVGLSRRQVEETMADLRPLEASYLALLISA